MTTYSKPCLTLFKARDIRTIRMWSKFWVKGKSGDSCDGKALPELRGKGENDWVVVCGLCGRVYGVVNGVINGVIRYFHFPKVFTIVISVQKVVTNVNSIVNCIVFLDKSCLEKTFHSFSQSLYSKLLAYC